MNTKITKEELKTGMILIIEGEEWLVMKDFLHGHNITQSEVALNLDKQNEWEILKKINMEDVTTILRPSHLYGVVNKIMNKVTIKDNIELPYEVCYQENDKMITIKGKKYSEDTIHEALKNHAGE